MLWFRLASLWGCTVAEAQERCTSREFGEWKAFYRLEPFGEERADWRIALLGTSLTKKDVWSFMPFVQKPQPKEQDEDEIRKTAEGINWH